MNFFFDKKPVTGTAANSWLSLVLAIACAGFLVVGFIIGRDFLLFGIVCWIAGILMMRKGLVSDTPKPAKIGRVILYVDVALVIGSAVATFVRTLSLIGG